MSSPSTTINGSQARRGDTPLQESLASKPTHLHAHFKCPPAPHSQSCIGPGVILSHALDQESCPVVTAPGGCKAQAMHVTLLAFSLFIDITTTRQLTLKLH
eukprot:scaffold228214_cov18-Tisochrysis_lutea.AAC.1